MMPKKPKKQPVAPPEIDWEAEDVCKYVIEPDPKGGWML
jgi:hypothetical protein